MLVQQNSVCMIQLAHAPYNPERSCLHHVGLAHVLKLPIPVTIVTGHLGVGKTTAIASLVRQKPPAERWAILVNEIGSLGIDAAMLEGSATSSLGEDVTVQQLAGGCMCCTLAGAMGVAIAQLVRRAKPDRLIIEPSGLGHPAGLLDVLQGPHLRTALSLKAVVVLVDPTNVGSAEWQESELVQSQVAVADVMVFNKADLATADDLAAAHRFALDLFPPKLQVLEASMGHVPLDLLSISRDASYVVARSPHHRPASVEGESCEAPTTAHHGSEASPAREADRATERVFSPSVAMSPRCPIRFEANASGQGELAQQGQHTCGWMFHPDDVFDARLLRPLMALLWGLCLRVKGVFRIGKDYAVLRLGGDGELELAPIAYRRESRVEVILKADGPLEPAVRLVSQDRSLLDTALSGLDGVGGVVRAIMAADWGALESALLETLVKA